MSAVLGIDGSNRIKHNKIFRASALAVSLSLLVMVAMPATPALAQSATMSPPSGFIGTKVTIEGRAFYKNNYVYLYFGDTQLKSIKVSETGTFAAYFNVPRYATPGESYYVTIRDDYGTTLARWRFIVAKAKFKLDPEEGKIGDSIRIDGLWFDANEEFSIYFSSDKAFIGDDIDSEVTAYYQCVRIAFTNTDGDFITPYGFIIPNELTDGKDKEDVHGGDYYFYATYFLKKRIEAVAKIVVIDGEIELDPDEGQVGTEVEISGEGLRDGQKITIEYDGDNVDIASGNEQTDSEGKFTCTIIIPESTTGNHIITVIDESGNKPEAEFSVGPKITVNPTSATVGKTVNVSGTGFGDKEDITITFNGNNIPTTPTLLYTNRRGSFNCSFVVPSYAGYGTSKVRAIDKYSFNMAETQLTILAIPATPASISLKPVTSLTSPGHVGMELTIQGAGFTANTTAIITYSNGEAITLATVSTNANGNFSATFTIPPSSAGSHTVTATDGTNTATSVFTMESEAPPMPVPLLPEVATTIEAEAYFDWTDVTDPSGITYIFQIGTDVDFATIVLEGSGLTDSEYTLTKEEKLKLTEKEAYYWRVKAVDGAFNESEWTSPGLFYVGFSRTSIPSWALYIWIGLGTLLLAILGFWVRRRATHH